MQHKISLIVPLKDEAASIARLLGSISGQARIPDEVVFVDAGSHDATRSIIESHADGHLAVRVLSIGPAYPGTARNAGVRAARHEVIAFTDGGIELDKDWLRELSAAMDGDAPPDVVYGAYVPRTDTFFKECLAIAVVPPARPVAGGRMRPRFIASSLLRKSVWQDLGGFPDLRAGEDRIFMEQIGQGKYRVAYSPRAYVTWDVPGTVPAVFNRFSQYSYHDLRSGRTGDWHRPVARMYLAAAVFLACAVFVTPWWALVPCAALAARAAKKVFINRNEPYVRRALAPLYLACAAFLIVLVDVAMFAGCVRYGLEAMSRYRAEKGRRGA